MSRWSRFVLLFALLAAPAGAQVIPSGPVGALNYWGVGGLSQVLNPGLAGQCLTTQGVGSAPVWVNCQVSSLSLLPPINTNQFYGNVSGQFSPPVGVDVNTILNTVGYDIVRPPTPESIIYKSNVGPTFNWQALPPGPSGALLTSGGPTNPPFWSASTVQASLAAICQTIGAVLYFDTPSLTWKCLNPGTNGQVLKTGGANGNPSYFTLAPSATTDTTNASNITSGTLPASVLPTPTASALGGVFSATAPANQFQTGVNTSGAPTFAQPGFANISGVASLAQGGLGGSQAAATANQIPVYPGSAGAAAPTSIGGSGGLFDTVCSSTVGQIWVRITGGWGCSQAVPMPATAYGVKCDGSTDDTANINAALAAHATIVLPAGNCITSGPINLNSTTNYLIGQGQTTTTIRSSAASQPVISVNAGTATYWGVSNLTVLHSVTATSGGDGIVTSGLTNNAWINNVITQQNYNGLNLSTAVYAVIQNVITQLNVNNGVAMASTASSGGLQWQMNGVISQSNGANGFAVNSVAGPGATTLGEWSNIATGFNTGFGLVFQGVNGDPIANIRVSGLFAGQDGNSEVFLNTFDVANSHTFTDIHLELVGTSTTGPSGSTAASHIGNGFELTSNNAAVMISNCWIEAMSQSGIQSAANALNVQNCAILNNSSNGISIASGGGVYAQNNRIYNTAGTAQHFGVALASGTAFNSINNNDFVGPNGAGNSSGAISNASTAVNNVIQSNNGFNPVGVTGATAVGASPATVCAGPSPETDYLNQSATNTGFVTQGGQQMMAFVNSGTFYPVQLGPNECIVVTWTTTQPTRTKFVH